jgi:hypothetical protein
MKKILLIMVFAVLPLLGSAQGFRGFLDVYAGTSFSKGFTDYGYVGSEYSVSGIKPDFVFGLNVTEGYQITNYLFAGVGFGGYASMLGYDAYDGSYMERDRIFYSIYLPVFADVRWTLNMNSRITPFVDMKIGYQFGVSVGSGELFDYYFKNVSTTATHKNGLYFQPSIGVRFGKATGFNLGVAYNTSVGTRFMLGEVIDGKRVKTEVGSSNAGVLMLTLGADF